MNWFGKAMPPAALVALEEPSVPAVEDVVARKTLSALGHHLSLLEGAAKSLRGRVTKKRLEPTVSAFLERWLPPVTVSESGAPLVVGLSQAGGRFRIEGLARPAVSSQVWALLRLPSLRRLWGSYLRRAHFQHLVSLSPDIWVMDATPIPPGGVIAGLNLTSWQDLDTLRGAGRRFEIIGASSSQILDEDVGPEEWRAVIAEAIQAGDRCLIEHHDSDAYWLAEFSEAAGEIRLIEARTAFTSGVNGARTASRLQL